MCEHVYTYMQNLLSPCSTHVHVFGLTIGDWILLIKGLILILAGTVIMQASFRPQSYLGFAKAASL